MIFLSSDRARAMLLCVHDRWRVGRGAEQPQSRAVFTGGCSDLVNLVLLLAFPRLGLLSAEGQSVLWRNNSK